MKKKQYKYDGFISDRKTDCIKFDGQIDSVTGYGILYIGRVNGKKRNTGAHRAALEKKMGHPIPHGMKACHSCDWRPCVNEDHLFLGSSAINQKDMADKGRNQSGDKHYTRIDPSKVMRGSKNGRSILTEEDVAYIKIAHSSGMTQKELAVYFGVHPTTISKIFQGKNWAHEPSYFKRLRIPRMTPDQVIDIKLMRLKGISTRNIANELGIGIGAVKLVANGTSWKHINP